MNLKQFTRNGRILLLSVALCHMACPASASPIEQIGDRYIIHVPELDLRGDESLIDILMMCPDVISLDGKTVLTDDPLAALFGKYALRFDNVDYGLDINTLLHNLKAREIEKVQICTNSEVMKGAGSMKKIIDIHLRRDVAAVKGLNDTYYAEGTSEKGTAGEKASGRVGLFGDTYGGGEAIASLRYHTDRLVILSHVEGNMQRSAFSPSSSSAPATNHRSHEGVNVSLTWDITPKDQLMATAIQTYARNRLSPTPAAYERNYTAELDYTHTLADNGSSVLLTLGTAHTADSRGEQYGTAESTAYQGHYTYPYSILEFYFPLFIKDLWVTAGFEGGLSYEKNCIAQYTNRSNYEDLYAQVDWNIGKWSIMLGDRYRTIHFRHSEIKDADIYKHSTHTHAYTASVYYHFTPSHTLQGTFSRRFFNADFSDFIAAEMDDPQGSSQMYTPEYLQRYAYVSELRHHISTQSFMLSSVIQSIRQDTGENTKDQTLGIGTTAFWHTGALRLTAGANYYWERDKSKADGNTTHQHFAVFKLAPQVSLPAEWRLTSSLLWSTRRSQESHAYAPANLYAEAAIYKTICRHWLAEVRYHDIAGQHWGNRAATIGCTYYF